ncbi:ABC transporter permease [Baekduia soli]|uniref:ABC transporter permease n=1 Tax=Baekduia soli TaxID=496014 RepID=UPI0016527971|nr:ABC transporter permease [Baekduia soli]
MTALRGSLHVALAVFRRYMLTAIKNPALFIPAMLFPLLFLVSFAGGLSRVADVPGFDFPSGYTSFQFVFVFLQSAAFGGVFTGFAVAFDFENGFARRLLLAAPHRSGLVLGYVLSAIGRFALTGVAVTVAGLVGGMRIDGSGVDLVGLLGLAIILNAAATLWAVGIALRAKTVQAGPVMQIPIFLVLFLAPVYVPLDLLTGWIEAVASWNPLTAIVEAGRGFISGQPTSVALSFGCAVGLTAVLTAWAMTGLRRVERGV